MILNVSHLSKAFAGNAVLKDASFFLNERDKAAVVGLNGAGKTTLLNLITGELPADSGTVTVKKDCTLGYLRQNIDLDPELTILEELNQVIRPVFDLEDTMALLREQMKHASGEALERLYESYSRAEADYERLDGYTARSRVNGILNGLGFSSSDAGKRLGTLSGGQKTRVFLGKLLLEHPDIILLDEPTNHLDLSSIEWLEGYLMNYTGTVLIVSHDRYFLDRIVNRVLDVELGTVESYSGNYTQFAEKKAQLLEARRRAFLNQQQEIRRQEEVIRKLKSFNREKSIKRAESREKQLEKTERLERPETVKADMALRFTMETESGNDVLEADGLSKRYGAHELFRGLSFSLKKGEHVCIIGDNGTGKTTILKILNGFVQPEEGAVTLGAGVIIAYYDQEQQVLHPDKTLFEELQDTWPDMNNTEVRNMLAAFLFTGDDAMKRVRDLSGGERGRVSLAKLMLSKANFLMLDEPTNHLDMVSKEILESAIRSFPGTVLCVSHDRYFINRTATRILELKQGKLLNYIGNYDYYLEKRPDVERAAGLLPEGLSSGNGSAASGTRTVSGVNAVRAPHLSSSGSASASVGSMTGPGMEDLSRNAAGDAGRPVQSSGKADWEAEKLKKSREKKRLLALKSCEEKIEALEGRISSIEEQFLDPALQRDASALIGLQKDKEEAEEQLAGLYEEWEVLSEAGEEQ